MDTFIHRFLLSILLVTLLIVTIVLLKRVLNKHLSVKAHYQIWFFLSIPLITPFFPWGFFKLEIISDLFKTILTQNRNLSLTNNRVAGASVPYLENRDLLHDLAVSVNRSTSEFFFNLGMTIWVLGMVILVGWIIYSNIQIRQIKKTASFIKDHKINELLEECKEIVGVKRGILLQESSKINSPLTLGLLKPYILLPLNTCKDFSLHELKYVFLHELSHQKSKDVLINYIMWILQTIYWFNPFVWYALKRMRVDRELACDASVLNLIDERAYIEYGQTIIHFASGKYNHAYQQFVPGMGGTKKQMKQRILSIAKYTRDSQRLIWKSKAICIALGILVLGLTPFTYVVASSDDVYEFTKKNVIYEDLSNYFNGHEGSFVLYDATKKQYLIYNREMSQQRVSPNSTYKIYSALFALESKVISPDSTDQVWDGRVQPFKVWNQNQNLSTAMGSSVNWYFQNLDQKVGKKQLQDYFHKIKYGNENISGPLDSYWMESTLKVSPIEQVELLVALEENGFGFKEENIQAVKQAISIEKKERGQLFGKTGTGTINGQDVNGWFIGYIEEAGQFYYFAVNIQKNGANGSKAVNIVKHILDDKNIYWHSE